MKASMLYPTPLSIPEVANNNKNPAPEKGASFGDMLQDKIREVDSLKKEADTLTERLMAGEPVELHEVMLATEKADLALQLTVQIRNKLVEAYQEISRMQV